MASKPLHVKLRDKRNHPPEGEPWLWLTRELIESDAWHTAPINTRRFVERLMLEHMAHAGTMNGELVCTYADCVKFGIFRRFIRITILDAIARGLVDMTQQGKASSGSERWPSRFALGWLPRRDGAAALNRWKAYRTPAPITQDLNSSSQKCTGANGRNPRSPVHKGEPASSTQKCTGKSRKTANRQYTKVN